MFNVISCDSFTIKDGKLKMSRTVVPRAPPVGCIPKSRWAIGISRSVRQFPLVLLQLTIPPNLHVLSWCWQLALLVRAT